MNGHDYSLSGAVVARVPTSVRIYSLLSSGLLPGYGEFSAPTWIVVRIIQYKYVRPFKGGRVLKRPEPRAGEHCGPVVIPRF